MKWKLKAPRFGDIVRVEAGQFYHYGIYASDEEIIQFGPTPDAGHSLLDADIRVCTSDVNGFLKGGFLEVASFSLSERLKAAPPAEIVARARKEIGTGGYDILKNNCEHFVNACAFGVKKSEQVDSVRDFWKNVPVLDVYVAVQPESVDPSAAGVKARQKLIDETRNERLKAQRAFAWQVLCAGLNRSLGLDAETLRWERTESGKWTSDACEVSISHCDGAVAAAVSRRPVGVDLEPENDPRCRETLLDRIATDAEREAIKGQRIETAIMKLWTAKEASFKRKGGDRFSAQAEDTTKEPVRSIRIRLDRAYILSVSGENLKNLRVYETDGELHAHRRTDFESL